MHDPREPHLAAIKRILYYVHDILDYGLHITWSTFDDFVAFFDAN